MRSLALLVLALAACSSSSSSPGRALPPEKDHLPDEDHSGKVVLGMAGEDAPEPLDAGQDAAQDAAENLPALDAGQDAAQAPPDAAIDAGPPPLWDAAFPVCKPCLGETDCPQSWACHQTFSNDHAACFPPQGTASACYTAYPSVGFNISFTEQGVDYCAIKLCAEWLERGL